MLAALGIAPEVCHLNEGHAAHAVLDARAVSCRPPDRHSKPHWLVTLPGNLFATHTAVAAGIDRFAPTRIEHCLGDHARRQFGIALHDLLALGRWNPDDASEPF